MKSSIQMRSLQVCVDGNEWASTYSLPQRSDCCPRCGVDRFANIPFALDGYRGLMSELHGCGEEYRLRVFRPIGKRIGNWRIGGDGPCDPSPED